MIAARYIDRFPPGAVAPVRSALAAGWVVLALMVALALAVDRQERRAAAHPADAPAR